LGDVDAREEAIKAKFFSGAVPLDHESYTSNPIWKKFEYFNFNFSSFSEVHDALEQHFNYLYQAYITNNFVESNKNVDMTAFLLDGKYDLLNSQIA
jgi:hypothetical protein